MSHVELQIWKRLSYDPRSYECKCTKGSLLNLKISLATWLLAQKGLYNNVYGIVLEMKLAFDVR